MSIASDISLNLSWSGDTVRINHAHIVSASDADKMIQILTTLRGALPGGEPQAVPDHAPAQAAGRAHHPIPAATNSTAARKDELGLKVIPADMPEPDRTLAGSEVSSPLAGDEVEPGAGTQSPPVELPEAAASEHPEAHSMATGGKQDAGAVASGHESEAVDEYASVPLRTGSATRKDAVAAASDPNAEGKSAGGRAETDASPAAPNTETTGPLPSAGEAARAPASPAPKRSLTPFQQQVLNLHREHPDWACSDIAKAAGAGSGHVANTCKRLGIKLPHKQTTSLASRLRTYAAENPTHTIEDCATALGETVDRVRSNANANKIKFAPGRRGRKPAPEQRKPDPAPTPAPQAKPAPAVKSEPARPGSVIMHRAPVRPTGQQFWLRDDAGRYLHRFCHVMTTDKRDAWTGNQDQLTGCRRKFPLARDLREQPVEKAQPMPAARLYA